MSTTHTRSLVDEHNTPMADGLVDGSDSVVVDTFQWMRKEMSQIVADVSARFDTIHPHQGHPRRFAGLIIHHQGAPIPLHQLAQLSTPTLGQLRIRPYDKGLISEIEAALAQVGFQGQIQEGNKAIILQMPEIKDEDKKEMIRELHRIIERGRISVRQIRRKAMDMISQQEPERNSEMREQRHIQEITDTFIEQLRQLCEARQKELSQLA